MASQKSVCLLLVVCLAVLTSAPPPSPTTCVSQNGQVYNPGDAYQNGCLWCQCKEHGEECYPHPCPPPPCQNPVHDATSCCGTCPNGPDCVDQNTGLVIPVGQTLGNGDGMECYCPPGGFEPFPEPICY